MPKPRWEIVRPTDEDDNALFMKELEDDPMVLFHVSPASNLASISTDGFRSAADLATGILRSVSYSKTSRSWNTITGYPATRDFVIFAVRFDTLDQQGIQVNSSDIHVFRREIQPTILGYCELPNGYTRSWSRFI